MLKTKGEQNNHLIQILKPVLRGKDIKLCCIRTSKTFASFRLLNLIALKKFVIFDFVTISCLILFDLKTVFNRTILVFPRKKVKED